MIDILEIAFRRAKARLESQKKIELKAKTLGVPRAKSATRYARGEEPWMS
jgi:hypothetical protein